MTGLLAAGAAALISIATVLAGSAATLPDEVVAYPAPSGQALSSEYSVKVRSVGGEWKDLDVYAVGVDRDTNSTAAMVAFDMQGPVELSVARARVMKSARVRPLSYGIAPTIGADKKTATVTIPRPMNVSFEVDGDLLHNLHVFADPIERDVPREGPRVIVFAPGLYVVPGDHVLRIPSNTTVYVSGGAVVKGAIAIEGALNVSVRGHGVIDPSNFFEPGRMATIAVRRSENVGIRDVMLLGGPNSGVSATNSNGLVVANVKDISAGRFSDGVNIVSSKGVLVDGGFFRTSDDSIAVYATTPWRGGGGTRDVTVRNSTLWADVAHPINVGTHGDSTKQEVIERIAFQNLDILEHDEYRGGDRYQGAMTVNAGDSVIARDIRFDDVRVEDFTRGQVLNVRVFFNPDYNRLPGTRVEHLLFRNIRYDGSGDDPSRIEGYDGTHRVANVTFENLVWNGSTILDPAQANIRIGPNASGVRFVPAQAATTLNDTSKSIRYVGRWLPRTVEGAYDGDLRAAASVRSRMAYAFNGRQVRAYGLTGPSSGQVEVWLDGKYAATVDAYSPTQRAQQIWFESGVLRARSHRLELRCRATKSVLSRGVAVTLDKLEVVR